MDVTIQQGRWGWSVYVDGLPASSNGLTVDEANRYAEQLRAGEVPSPNDEYGEPSDRLSRCAICGAPFPRRNGPCPQCTGASLPGGE